MALNIPDMLLRQNDECN